MDGNFSQRHAHARAWDAKRERRGPRVARRQRRLGLGSHGEYNTQVHTLRSLNLKGGSSCGNPSAGIVPSVARAERLEVRFAIEEGNRVRHRRRHLPPHRCAMGPGRVVKRTSPEIRVSRCVQGADILLDATSAHGCLWLVGDPGRTCE